MTMKLSLSCLRSFGRSSPERRHRFTPNRNLAPPSSGRMSCGFISKTSAAGSVATATSLPRRRTSIGWRRSGVRFDRFYTCAGVCSAMRSGTVTGMMQTSIGAHQHRSHRNVKIGDYVDSHDLPNGIKTIPQYFRDAGYYTFNDGKDDYNFNWNKDELYDSFGKMNFQGDEWSGCPTGQTVLRADSIERRKGSASVSRRTKRWIVPPSPCRPTIQTFRSSARRSLIITTASSGPISKSA